MSITQSLLLYSAGVWAYVLGKEVYRKRIAQVQRRVAFTYRTVSHPAVMVIAEVIPVAFLTKERQAIYKRRGDDPREMVAREERQRTLDVWQN